MKQRKLYPAYKDCPIRHVISRIGDKWSMLVCYTLYQNGTVRPMRYSELREQMCDCSPKMLSATLKRLEQMELVCRKAYAEVPPHVEYTLTSRGLKLIPCIDSLIQWAVENFHIPAATEEA